MNIINEIVKIREAAIKEAEEATQLIFAKYDDKLVDIIKRYIPEGGRVISGNGICIMEDKNGEQVGNARAWGLESNREDDDKILEEIALLQYRVEIELPSFSIPGEITAN